MLAGTFGSAVPAGLGRDDAATRLLGAGLDSAAPAALDSNGDDKPYS